EESVDENETIKEIVNVHSKLDKLLVDFTGFTQEEVKIFIIKLLRSRRNDVHIENILLYDLDLFNNFKGYIRECINLYIKKERNNKKPFMPYKLYNNMQNLTVADQIGYIDHILNLFENFSSNEDTS
ncbi:MAG: hypothetical protein Q4B92_07945, partial [Ruminococcus sp.]|nr:hypothetical protein [Ruminococcus sp.]